MMGLFWLPVKSVRVPNGLEEAFPCQLTRPRLLFVFSDLDGVHSDLEPRRALKVAFSPEVLVPERVINARPSPGSL